MHTIDLNEKFEAISDRWNPRILASLNGQDVKLAKIEGDFVWHAHQEEDEMFFVVRGRLELHFRDKIEVLLPGQIIVVPKGVEHKPLATEETWIMLFEPQSTDHTGGVETPLRREKSQRI
ncbi:MAG: mannose-6-phosphate isomerase [Crocinitomicaceae bacterium]|nr:mannose-6-phosphate isomerase [Crocinitomicaceae bacterium]|tara:strand:+ start:595 stop:954 length:360 start_codon:yes stop_codon:yes gene_type:complete